jgi:hypothetical protein
MQYIEEIYREKAEDAFLAKGSDGSAHVKEFFTGKATMAGGAIICPALLKSAASSAAQHNDILKQRRKLLETKSALAKKKP